MELNQILEQRYSVRKYADRKVETEKLEQILAAAKYAPSAVNNQPVRLIVVTEQTGLDVLGKATRFYDAPLAIIVCADKDVAWTRASDGKNHADIDASIMTDYMMLKATELGLGSLWICWFDTDVVRKEFNIPDNWEPINILALGYTADDCTPSKRHGERREQREYVFYEKF